MELDLIKCVDALEGLKELPCSCVDTIITDPPYGLRFMGKRWDYDVPKVEVWQECLRVLKPGGTALIFAGSRTQHRMAVNVEDAGFIIRDCIMWIYGSGFPKSLNIGKAVDKMQGNDRRVVGEKETQPGLHRSKSNNHFTDDAWVGDDDKAREITQGFSVWVGWGTALKPAYEPIIVAMKPTNGSFAENALRHGVAGLNIDECRIESVTPVQVSASKGVPFGDGNYPIGEGRVYHDGGRFPANIIHDGSDEVMSLFPYTKSGETKRTNTHEGASVFGNSQYRGDFDASCGSAARFFYCAKASKEERNRGAVRLSNNHPTVKPLALMEYLCKLTKTPTGGIVLDPFIGSGTTAVACRKTGRQYLGFEISPEYCEIAEARLSSWKGQKVIV